MPGTMRVVCPAASSARKSTGSPGKSESGLPSTPKPMDAASSVAIAATKCAIASSLPRASARASGTRPRSTAMLCDSSARTRSGGASSATTRALSRKASRLPTVRYPGSPGPRPTIRTSTLKASLEKAKSLTFVRLLVSYVEDDGAGTAPFVGAPAGCAAAGGVGSGVGNAAWKRGSPIWMFALLCRSVKNGWISGASCC